MSTKNKIQLTKQGHQDLQDELDRLLNEKLPDVVKRISVARDKGDLSENTEYQNAKEEKDIYDARVAEIEDVLKRAEVVGKTRSRTKVGIGSKVVVHIKGNKTKMDFELVGEFEGNAESGKISTVSPIGEALVDKKEGDEVVVEAPAGKITYVIDKVK